MFSFGCCLQEVFSRVVTSTVVVGPTGNPNAATVYGLKVRLCKGTVDNL